MSDRLLDGIVDDEDLADLNRTPTAPESNLDKDIEFPDSSDEVSCGIPFDSHTEKPGNDEGKRKTNGNGVEKASEADPASALAHFNRKVREMPKNLGGGADDNYLKGVNPDRVILEHCGPVLSELVRSHLELRADVMTSMKKHEELLSEIRAVNASFVEGSSAYRSASESIAKGTAKLAEQVAYQFKLIRQDTSATRVTNDQNNIRLTSLVATMEGIHKQVRSLTEKSMKELLDSMKTAITAFLGQSVGESVMKYGFAALCLGIGVVIGGTMYHWGYVG